MEDSLRQFYHETRTRAHPNPVLLTPSELELKTIVTKCIQALTTASNNNLSRLVQVFRAEGLQVSEPSIRNEKFIAAAVVVTFEPLAKMFVKL